MRATQKISMLGNVAITVCDGAVTALEFDVQSELLFAGKNKLLDSAFEQIEAYLGGKLKRFDLPINPSGTPFQKRVWAQLGKIEYGQTMTYSQVAKSIGCPQSARAVGGACHRNPIALIIPCHRVVGAAGLLGGYAGGVKLKKKLLELEMLHYETSQH